MRAAISIASPASFPPAAAVPFPSQVPMDFVTGAAVPDGPTTVKLARPEISRSASAAAMISGPMPRGSPTVIASRGRLMLVSATRREREDPHRFLRAVRVRAHVHRLSLRIDVLPHLADLLELRANARLDFVVAVIAGLGDRCDLRDDELVVADRGWNREGDDRILLHVLESRLITRRQ